MQSCGAKIGFSGSSTMRTFLSAKLAFFPDGNLDACVVKLTLSPPEVISNCTYGCATACEFVRYINVGSVDTGNEGKQDQMGDFLGEGKASGCTA